ncbi:MAG: hypothetical protein WCA36_12300 [Pseudolabrys sp.]
MADNNENPFAGIAELQRRISDSMRPIVELQERLNAIATCPPIFTALENAARQFAEYNEQIRKAIAPATIQFTEFATRFAQLERKRQLLDQAGFLPHISTPMNLIEEHEGTPDQLSESIEDYYRNNWRAIQRDLTKRIASYDIDDEAKQALCEALECHGHGLYRATCRHLLSEIERVARVELHNDTLSTITSQHALQEIAGDLSYSEIEPIGYFGLELFNRLSSHLYVPVRDEEQRQQIALDPVPNRHAALHGLVVYRSFKNSLNTIFMMDYVLQIVNAVKRRKNESVSTP